MAERTEFPARVRRLPPVLQSRLAVLLVVWLVSALYLALRADRDWIPPDEGALGQSAERVLAGEWPHRDFDEVWTGGLAFLNALGFRLFGVTLHSLRLVLLTFSLAFVPAVYAIASRVAPPLTAGLVTLFCVAWSLPNYFSGVASWYNLFFATFGTLAFLRHVETDRRRWLLVAGACGGISFLFKSTGLYFVAASGLFLLYRDQVGRLREPARERPGGLGVIIAAGLLCFDALLLDLVRGGESPMDLLHFALPALVVTALLLRNEWTLRRCSQTDRLRRLWGLAWPYACGLMLPIAAFAAPYAAASSLPALYRAVFVAPRMRLEHANLALPSPWTLLTVAPLAVLLAAGLRGRRWSLERVWGIPFALALGLVAFFGARDFVHRAVWDSVRPSVPLVTVVGCALLLWPGAERRLTASHRQQTFLLVAAAAMTSLVQFPYAAGVYFCFAAPLAILAIHFVVSGQPAAPKTLLSCLLAFYLAFAVVWNHRASTFLLGFRYHHLAPLEPLELERGGLRVLRPEAELYRRLVAAIRSRSPEGAFIYATPDSPEVYFLAARRNPTRTLYDLFDPDYARDPAGRTRRILATLEEKQVDVVVLRRRSESSQLPRNLLPELRARYPHREDFPVFTMRWRTRRASGETRRALDGASAGIQTR